MTDQELQALVILLQRIPMTLAEQLWLQDFIQELAAEIKAKQQPEPQHAGMMDDPLPAPKNIESKVMNV